MENPMGVSLIYTMQVVGLSSQPCLPDVLIERLPVTNLAAWNLSMQQLRISFC